ncbi:hypothetical protein MVEN_01027400 [Mycena venus]|uniref:F-box domain-containing protein n=1 Tax=Mycena venus TaxID=2733690 RepID=A0A8H6YF75_9AGAR|nr:hypothetical protein MVEN_01027400 [Mycena venus]
MHPALQIGEVVEMICTQVAPYGATCSHVRRDLSRLARTSSIFLDPTLNILWRHQDSIVNLLRCMPDQLWKIEETRPDDYEPDFIVLDIVLLRPITPADWERFFFYSHRVKSFSIEGQPLLETPEVYEILGICLTGEFIFPKLQKLDWEPIPSEFFHHVRLFLAPTITNLRIFIKNTSYLSMLSTLAIKCPGLTNVTISTTFLSELDTVPVISSFVCALRHIEILSVPRLDQAALSHIARLPSQVAAFEPPIPSPRCPAGSHHFPALTGSRLQ